MLWLKLLHFSAVAIWAAGLLCLPGLYRARSRHHGAALRRMNTVARFIYVVVISPAAFLGIGSGVALIFLRQTHAPWLTLKLALVGGMVTAHVVTGLVIVRHFETGGVYPAWRFIAVSCVTLALICGVIVLALAEPDPTPLLPTTLFEPSGLGRLADRLMNDLNHSRK